MSDEQTHDIQTNDEIIATEDSKIGQAATFVTATATDTVEVDEEVAEELKKKPDVSDFAKQVDVIYFYHEKLMPHYENAEQLDEVLKNGSMKDVRREIKDLDNIINKSNDIGSKESANYLKRAIPINVAVQKLEHPESLSAEDKRYFNHGGALGFTVLPKKLSYDEIEQLTNASLLAIQEAGAFHGDDRDIEAFKAHMREKYIKMNENGLSRGLRQTLKCLNDQNGRQKVVAEMQLAKVNEGRNYSDELRELRQKNNNSEVYTDKLKQEDSQAQNYSSADLEGKQANNSEQKEASEQVPVKDAEPHVAASETVPDDKKNDQHAKGKLANTKTKPTESELTEYAHKIGFFSFNAKNYISHYEKCGWKTADGDIITDYERNVRYWQHNAYTSNRFKTDSAFTAEDIRRHDLEKCNELIRQGGIVDANMDAFAPTRYEVRKFCKEKNLNAIKPDEFYKDFIEKGHMKLQNGEYCVDWKNFMVEQNATKQVENVKKEAEVNKTQNSNPQQSQEVKSNSGMIMA